MTSFLTRTLLRLFHFMITARINRTAEDKFLIWLVFEHVLLLVKVLVHVIIPDHPASLTIIKARQRWVGGMIGKWLG